ncbi:MAG TPA: NAD(P)H-dependent oxidoreductase [Lentimicrobium sp.]|jgi:NAD(P)H-dependent FMN reductase|nr:NAD(P)H-dependent oxidoreductase [Lentimicrobium sp.]
MYHIGIISSSVRIGRNSHRAALFFKHYIESNNLATAEIIDLNDYKFPIFEERLSRMENPLPSALEYAERVKKADGIIIVTPEYNGGYPPAIKNAIDLLYNEWYKKPVAISTCSDGVFGGTQVITSLQFSLWKIRAWTVPAMFPNPKVQELYDENGVPANEFENKRAKVFLGELLWCIEAKKRME